MPGFLPHLQDQIDKLDPEARAKFDAYVAECKRLRAEQLLLGADEPETDIERFTVSEEQESPERK
jgi:hypothetical protein